MNPILALLLFATAFAPSVHADQSAPERNRVSFDVTVEEMVDSDLLVVRLFSQHQARKQAAAANKVNEDMTWALKLARAVPDVRSQTLDYRTSPIYDERNITGWQTRQALRLESANRDALSELLGGLQERLAIESLGYEVSAGLRARTELRLIDLAIERFSARAVQVSAAFARNAYTLVNVHISTQGQAPQPVAYMGRAMAMKAEMADPGIEAGQQSLAVSVNGTIELSAQ